MKGARGTGAGSGSAVLRVLLAGCGLRARSAEYEPTDGLAELFGIIDEGEVADAL